MNINVKAEKVAIDSIKPHPKNPRLGDIALIAESLEKNGQYSPVVVWNDTIIAGTHTWKAAKSLGWKEVAITRYEGSEKDALRVLIADNRTSDVATYDNVYLLELLKSLPNLEGTGYDLADLDDLDGLGDSEGGGVSQEKDEPETSDEKPDTVPIRIGDWFGEIDGEIHNLWLESVVDAVGDKKSKVVAEIKARLDIPTEPKAPKEPKAKKAGGNTAEQYSLGETELVSLNELKRFPGNAREGDIGAISESLRLLGQYRPIVVNKRTNEILKGNHTAAAASALGWTQIAVVWVDVDQEQATRIVLADNRTADKATYDNDLLLSTLESLDTLDGTGFDQEDFIDVAKGKNLTPNQPKVKIKIGEHGYSTTESAFESWKTDVEIPNGALHRLGIPMTAIVRQSE